MRSAILQPLAVPILQPILGRHRRRGKSLDQVVQDIAAKYGGYVMSADWMDMQWQDAAKTIPAALEQPTYLTEAYGGVEFIQPVSTERMKPSARVNLFSYTNALENSWWTKNGNPVVVDNALSAPDGSATATSITNSGNAATYAGVTGGSSPVAPAGASYYLRCWILGKGSSTFPISIFQSGHKALSARVVSGPGTASVSSGIANFAALSQTEWSFIEIESQALAAGNFNVFFYAGTISPGGAGIAVGMWRPSLALAIDSHLPYQWVNTATDYDSDPSKFPTYWALDGTDDSAYTTNQVDMHGSDKVTVVAGVTKLSDVGGWYLDHGNATAGSFRFRTSNQWTGSARLDGSDREVALPGLAGVGPATSIQTLLADGDADIVTLIRDSGVQSISNDLGLGGGAFANKVEYLGARNDASQFFNGRIHCLAMLPALLTPKEQLILTKWAASKQKRSLP